MFLIAVDGSPFLHVYSPSSLNLVRSIKVPEIVKTVNNILQCKNIILVIMYLLLKRCV